MGTADPAERELVQGLIKLAAAFVHAARGNPLGMDKNLRGAQARLAEHLRLDRTGSLPDSLATLDVASLLAAIEALLVEPLTVAVEAPPLPRT
jgi:predicted metal-dependent hydrolase